MELMEEGVEHPECDTIIQELKAMKQRMDVLFHESLEKKAVRQDALEVGGASWSPAFDVYESRDAWFLAADLPGVPDDDLCIEVSDGVLRLSGKRSLTTAPHFASVHISERRSGSFRRSFVLPADAHHDQIEAELKRGVLTVKVPRMVGTSSIARKVPVRLE
jgi:HSP20 family protein